VNAVGGQIAPNGAPTPDVAAMWAIAHGLADLIASEPMSPVRGMDRAARDAFLGGIIRRALPAAKEHAMQAAMQAAPPPGPA
jgi:hypothetical protein